MTIETLPFEHRPRNSIANNLDKINELIDWVNLDTHLYASASGERVTVDDTSSLKGLTVDGRSVQDGTPTPDAPVPVEVVEGRNLLTSDFENGNYNPSTGLPTSSNVYARSQKTAVAQSTEYTISLKKLYATSGVYLYEWDASDTFLGQTALGSGSTTAYVKTFTTRATTSFVALSCGASSYPEQANTIKQPQLEAGTTVTPYVPYGCIGIVVGDTVTSINLQGNALASLPDGTRDELHIDSAGHCVLKKNVGEYTFNGSENWSLSGGAKRVNNNDLRALTRKASNNYTAISTMCNRFTSQTASQTYAGTVGVSIDTSGDVGFANGSTMDINTWKLWLESNNVVLLYPTATTQTIDLGYIDPPAIPSGSVVTISASLTPTFNLEWWVDDGITAVVDDLIAYIDYKTEG